MPKTVKFGADPREEGVTGGPRTTPMTPERKEVLRKAEEENARNRGKPPVKKADGGKISNFGKAFRAARKAGKKEFTFGGKSYNTKMKEEASKPAAEKPAAAAKPKGPANPPAASTAAARPVVKPVEPSVGFQNAARKREKFQGMGRAMGFRNDTRPSATAASPARPTAGPKVGEEAAGKLKGIKDFFGRGADALERLNTQERQKGANIGAKREAADAAVRKRADAIKDTGPAGGLDMAKKKLAKLGLSFNKGGKTEKGKTMKYSKGGLAAGHKSADGIAKKGKTKAMMPKMAKGGMTKKKAC